MRARGRALAPARDIMLKSRAYRLGAFVRGATPRVQFRELAGANAACRLLKPAYVARTPRITEKLARVPARAAAIPGMYDPRRFAD